TVDITGASSAPVVKFDTKLTDASVAAIRSAGLPALNIASAGTFAKSLLRIDADIDGAPGLALNVAGTVAVGGAGALKLAINGAAPLSLAQSALASRGASLSGTANLALSVGGTFAAPAISGSVSGSGGRFADPGSGVVLSDLAIDLGLDGDTLTIRQLTARAGSAGSLTVSGSAGIGAGSGYPLDISAQLRDGAYTDGDLVKTQFDADLTVTGLALDGPRISGTVRLDRTDITIPARLAVGAANIEVEHRNASAAVRKTLKLALPRAKPRRTSTGASASSDAGAPVIDIVLDAPARIFVRGRGIDAELGGRIALQGTPGRLGAVGGFDLRRGRMDILKQRITLTRGSIAFEGDLDPILNFAGTTSSNGYDITVAVTGRASNPKIAFSSSPSLPDDEVFAQFLYGRSIDELSPVQLVQLAAAVVELGGLTSGPGLLGRLRETTGLDDLDVVTDAQGNPAVRAGRYVSDNIYLGVEQGSGADTSRVTIDLDLGANIKARGALGNDGDSSIGLFFEKEY
ncbi:MAG: translocation/assembly module TamB domain-containing protein, partial [Alphaproteobacteria bacterium]